MQHWQNFRHKIERNNCHNIYLLQGEEEYFIDDLTQHIIASTLSEDEKSMNLEEYYGNELRFEEWVEALQHHSLFGGNKVVVIKEAQLFKSFKTALSDKQFQELEQALKNLISSPIHLIICHKQKTLNKNSKIYKLIAKNGRVFDSTCIKDYEVERFIQHYVQTKGKRMEAHAAYLLSEKTGNQLKILTNELDKIIQANNEPSISEETILKEIGEHREYNVFELQKALANGQKEKAVKIFHYFEAHIYKSAELIPLIAFLSSFFSKLMRVGVHSKLPDHEIASKAKVPPFFVKEYRQALKHYGFLKLCDIFSCLRNADIKSKGIGSGSNTLPKDIIRELTMELIV